MHESNFKPRRGCSCSAGCAGSSLISPREREAGHCRTSCSSAVGGNSRPATVLTCDTRTPPAGGVFICVLKCQHPRRIKGLVLVEDAATLSTRPVGSGMKRICVFAGSSRGARDDYAQAAEQVARELVKRDYGVVFGGGKVGMMGVLADA